jgi:outer membrane immunogenic protein
MRRILFVLALGLFSGQALAADLPQPVPPHAPAVYVPVAPLIFTWSGIYIGANGGFSLGTTTPSGLPAFNTNGALAGGTIGGNYQTGVFVFGAEGDFDWDNFKGSTTTCPLLAASCQMSSNWLATARGRVGVAWDRVLFYGTGGAAFANLKFSTPGASATATPFGWTAGGGVEFAISPNWSVKAEYLFVDFTNQGIGGATFSVIENVMRGGVNYRF